jgi:hypothetical protein
MCDIGGGGMCVCEEGGRERDREQRRGGGGGARWSRRLNIEGFRFRKKAAFREIRNTKIKKKISDVLYMCDWEGEGLGGKEK